MKVGDLVKCHPDVYGDVNPTGIITEVFEHHDLGRFTSCRVLWDSGELCKEWSDELEVISEVR